MINLLPPQEKEIILDNKRNKAIMIVWFLFFFFLVSLSLILYSLGLYIKGQVDYQKIILKSKENELERIGIKDFQDQAIESNKIIKELSSFYENKFYFSELIEKISNTLSGGIYLENISITNSEEFFKFTIAGFSSTREDLFDFKKNLEKTEFQNVFFPQSNWVKPKDIDFYASFDLQKNK